MGTLDNSVLNQISPFKSGKYTQEQDFELASVQRSMLNITGHFVAYMMLYVNPLTPASYCPRPTPDFLVFCFNILERAKA